jgi:hypothetical protein
MSKLSKGTRHWIARLLADKLVEINVAAGERQRVANSLQGQPDWVDGYNAAIKEAAEYRQECAELRLAIKELERG